VHIAPAISLHYATFITLWSQSGVTSEFGVTLKLGISPSCENIAELIELLGEAILFGRIFGV
jgi:hypothetical protein